MMGCASEAAAMSLYEYEQRLWHWNEAHETSGDGPTSDPDTTLDLIALINADPRLTH